MKRYLAISSALAMGMVSTLAHADVRSDSLDVRPNPFAVPGEAPRAIYRWTDPSLEGGPVMTTPAAVSHIIYLNNCMPNGCTLHPGNDNSTTDTSSIPNGQSLVSAYTGGSANWNAIVACVQASYAPFNVQVVTTRPAAGTNFHMAIVAGHAADVGEPQGVLGVSPFSCGYISNSISFSFANEEPTNVNDICWTVAQETAHSWGLDHKFDNRDPMTYLSTGPAVKRFQNQAGSCGEYNARTCSCTYTGTGNQQMNSYAVILQTFGGSAPDTTPPTVAITSPNNNASVMPSFAIQADVNDDIGVGKAELRIDGMLVGGPLSGPPWQWTAPATLGQGSHHVEVTAYDLSNNTAKAAIDVSFGSVCTKDSDCTDPMQVCNAGHCVAGPGQQGGIGTTCTSNTDCASGQCASDGTNHYCVLPCDPAMSHCPSNFTCLATGATGGVCWPGGDNGGGGGCTTGNGSGALLFGLGFAALLITRRRR